MSSPSSEPKSGTRLAGAFASATLAVTLLSCSERPLPVNLVWESVSQAVLIENSTLTAVAALSRDQAITVGWATPKGAGFSHATSFLRSGQHWSEVIVPLPSHTGSYVLLAVTRAPDGSAWACGSVRELQDEPSTARPIIYRFAGGGWSEISTAELGDLVGSELTNISAAGWGASFEVRATGTSGVEGMVLRFAGGHWSRMPVSISGTLTKPWSLTSVGRSPDGIWYTAGTRLDAPGGTVLADSGSGWRELEGPSGLLIQFIALAFDAEGTLWLTGNDVVGDSLVGSLIEYRAGRFLEVPIVRKSGGSFRLFGLGFDPVGHGWVVGGRTPDDLFAASLAGDRWVETVVKRETEGPGPPRPGEQGGEFFSVSLAAQDAGFAAGQTEEIGHKGELEVAARLYELRPRPAGERDALRPAFHD